MMGIGASGAIASRDRAPMVREADMSFKILVAALALAAVMPAISFAADAPAAKAGQTSAKAHKTSCYDAAWQSQEWKDCEAKMQAQGKK